MACCLAAKSYFRRLFTGIARTGIVAIPVLAFGLTDTKPARADIASTVVDDATAIITQLIEDSIATQAVPNAARRIPAACYYFPSTVTAIESKRYTALAKVLRKEVADAAGYAVYEAIVDVADIAQDPGNVKPANLFQDALRTLEQQVLSADYLQTLKQSSTPHIAASQNQTSPVASQPTTNSGLPLDARDPTTGKEALQRICYFANPTDEAQQTSDVKFRDDDLNDAIDALGKSGANAVALKALQDALQVYLKDKTSGASYTTDKAAVAAALAALSPAPPDAASAPLQTVLKAWQALVVTTETPVASISVATSQMRGCATKQLSQDEEIACSVAVLLRDAANGDDSLLVADAQRIEAAWLAKLNSKLNLAASDQNIAGLVTAIAKEDPAGAAAAVASICVNNVTCQQVLGFVQPLIARQEVATIEQLIELTGQLAVAYENVDTSCSYCNLIVSFSTGTDGVIKDVEAKDYGAAAGDTMDTIKNLACTADVQPTKDAFPGCNDNDKLVYTFLRSLAVYTVDSLASGTASTQPADADFRTAAVDLIEEYGGLGVRRSLVRQAAWAYVPEFSLRDAWRPGLIVSTSVSNPGGQFLVYPSVDMVRGRLRIPSKNVYLAFHGSLIDPLGPFVEVAARSNNINNAYQDPGVVLLASVVPRADFEVGLPDLSKNLVVGVGGAFRFYRVEPTGNGDNRYCVVGPDNCNAVGAGNFEFSIFAKFVP